MQVDPEEAKREAELGLLMLGDDEKVNDGSRAAGSLTTECLFYSCLFFPIHLQNAQLTIARKRVPEQDGREARRGYVMKDLLLKQRSGRGKRGKEIAASAEVLADEDFNLDLSDTRFGSIYTSSDFAIDPTHPKYVRSLRDGPQSSLPHPGPCNFD